MLQKKREHPKEKPGLHPRNRHRERYDFGALVQSCPGLAHFVKKNAYQDESIDFFNPEAVKMLNKALLKHYYGIDHWDIPSGYLCPPIPGRADYLHHMADLLASGNQGTVPVGNQIRCLDIGVGANCIYPIIGNRSYGWSFVGTDIDPVAINAATHIIAMNASLQGAIEIRLQENAGDIFRGVLQPNDHFEITICNPPFHHSPAEAQTDSQRKINNLKGRKVSKTVLNFGGQSNELWCEGGEEEFVRKMITESRERANSCKWFSALISKSAHLPGIYHALKMMEATEVKTIPIAHGNKISRIVTWNFLPSSSGM